MRNLICFLFICFLIKPSFARAEDINIAIIAPQVGEFQRLGSELISGAEIAVNNINENGGLNGKKINLIKIDDQCDDILSVSTAQMISVNSDQKDKISLVVGPYCSNSFDEISKIYEDAKIFQIMPTTVGASTKEGGYKGLVKMIGGVEKQGDDFFSFYKEKFSDRKVAIIYDSNDRELVDIAAIVQKKFIEDGYIENLRSFDFNRYKTYSSLAKEVFESGSDMAYILGSSFETQSIFKEIKGRKKHFVIFTNKYQIDDYSETLGNLAEGSYAFSLPSLKDNPSFTEQLVKLRLVGIEPEGLSMYSYSGVKLWEDIVNKAQSFDYNKLVKTLEKNKFETILGGVVFTNGSPENDINYSIYQIQSGEYKQVY